MSNDLIDISQSLSNNSRPKTSATLTIRIIKSFEFRTERSLVIHDINLETTTILDLKNMAQQAVQTQPGWKPYRNVHLGAADLSSSIFGHLITSLLDTLKLYTKAHGAKTSNLIINLDNDDWLLLDSDKTLAGVGFENETEVSFFNYDAYQSFKKNPVTRWD